MGILGGAGNWVTAEMRRVTCCPMCCASGCCMYGPSSNSMGTFWFCCW